MDIKLRQLRLRDSAFCRMLASEPTVRAASVDQRMPTFWGHVRWMWRWVYGDRVAMVILRKSWVETVTARWYEIGLVRASRLSKGDCEIGIGFLPENTGYGYGTWVLQAFTPEIAALHNAPIYARIKYTNRASVKAFKKAGYREADPGPWRRINGDDATVMVLEWKP